MDMQQQNIRFRSSLSIETGTGASQGLFDPILDKAKSFLRRTYTQAYAYDWEHKVDDCAPPVTNTVDTASILGPGTSFTPYKVVENKTTGKPKVVVREMDSGTTTKILIKRATHEPPDHIRALICQLRWQESREYIYQMVQNPLHKHKMVVPQSLQTVPVLMPPN